MTKLTSPKGTMFVRPYLPGDWPRLCAIHDAARRDELRLSVSEAAFLTLEQTFEDERLFAGEVVVAADPAGDVVGFAAWMPDELTWLYVAPDHYRKGVGALLLRHILSVAPGGMSTEVLLGNDPALQLYLKMGFRIDRKVEGRLEGNEGFAASGYVLHHPGYPSD